ncbi:MAG: cytochrome c, class I [Alphaproteobacteria bacterium]|nr:MAG: cytochrome c, class I [Alphaproteobacteria bacterium]
MTKRKIQMLWLGGFATITTLFLTSMVSVSAAPAKKAAAKKTDTMQIVRGAKAWKNNCSRCHNLRSPKELTDAEWDTSVAHMRVRANLAKADAEDIVAFLKASN